MRFKDVKDFVCKWCPSLQVEVPAALLLHVIRSSIFSNSSIILPRLRAFIGVTHSYSNCPFLCALAMAYNRPYAIPHVTKRETDSGRKSGYYAAILSGKEDRGIGA